jgi:HSP20 family protein
MAMSKAKVPVTKAAAQPVQATPSVEPWLPFGNLRREVDRLFQDFERGAWLAPLRRPLFGLEAPPALEGPWASAPAVDIVERDDAYEVTAELPGLDEKNIEVRLADGRLTIRGEKREDKEEKGKGYHLQERRYGSFERSFRVPEGVDVDKVDASFGKGVLKVVLPKRPDARKPAKKVEIKAS